jgi:4-hydroxybenzoate polyprenyltransferase
LDYILPQAPWSILYSLVTHPSLIATLIAILLISAASMVVNDYYDARLGVDTFRISKNKSLPSMQPKPLALGEVSFDAVKQFLYYLYSFLLLSSSLIPGIPTRLSVVAATILTFVYTKHLKPHTWIKNISCAMLMALSPFTSGAATLYTLASDQRYQNVIRSVSLSSFPSILSILLTSVGPLVLTLFCGFMSREIVMDISDYESDKASYIMTIPVKYGRRMAIRVAFGFLIAMSISACFYPVWRLFHIDWTTALSPALGLPKVISIIGRSPDVWNACFSILGSAWMMIRLQQVLRTEGEDRRVLDRFIEEGKGAIFFILASFLLK